MRPSMLLRVLVVLVVLGGTLTSGTLRVSDSDFLCFSCFQLHDAADTQREAERPLLEEAETHLS